MTTMPTGDRSDLATEFTPEMRRALAETCAFIIETRRQRLAQLAALQDAPADDTLEVNHADRAL